MSLLSDFIVESFLQESDQGLVVLLPGGFKPPHGGHLALAKRYAAHKGVSQVRVLIGPKEREGITRKQSLAVWKVLLAGDPKIVVEPVNEDNPLLAAYKYLEQAEPGQYALAASNKGEDYDRVKKFVAGHQKGGKYARPGVVVVELPLDASPIYYKGRTDSLNGKPISASTLRGDIRGKKFANFASNYPGISPDLIKKAYQVLVPSSTMLKEGGAAGHLVHPYEDLELSFEDVEGMIEAALSGQVESAQEKLDGQNLMVSYKDGRIVAARNKGHLKNFGENALSTKQVEDMFAGRGPIQTAFHEAMKDLEAAIGRLTTSQKSKFFQNGRRFLNLEVLYPSTANVVPYGATQLRLHNIRTYDQQGNVTDEDQESAKQLDGALRQVQADSQKTYQIKVTNPVTIHKSADYKKQKQELIGIVDQIVKEAGLSKKDKVGRYYSNWWSKFVDQQASKLGYKIKPQVRDLLVQRWGFDHKEIGLREIRNQINDPKFRAWMDQFDKQGVAAERKNAARPLERLFLKLGVYVLQNVENLVALNPNQSISQMQSDLKSAIDQIKKAAASPSTVDGGESLKFLKRELARLNDIGGFNAIAPTEGIVFKYNGKLYKLTGFFAPMNQIIGYLKFQR